MNCSPPLQHSNSSDAVHTTSVSTGALARFRFAVMVAGAIYTIASGHITSADDSSGHRKANAVYDAMAVSPRSPATVAGRFLMRNYVTRDTNADTEQIETRMRNWEKTFRHRDDEFRKAVLEGGGTFTEEDEQRLKAQFDRDMATWRRHEASAVSPTTTRYCSVSVKNQKYRFEQMKLPDDIPLAELADRIRSGEIDVASDAGGRMVVTWDASEANMLNVQVAGAQAGTDDRSGLTRVASDPITPIPDFFNAGRLGKETGNVLLRAAAADGASVGVETVASKAIPGARAERVTIRKSVLGIPLFSGYEMTTTVLPEQGYVVESESMTVNGVEVSRDVHSDFQPTGAGFWFPKSVVRERYEADPKTNQRRLKSRLEYLAVEDVIFNEPLDDGLFRLRGTPEFDSLPSMNLGSAPDRVGMEPARPHLFRWGIMLATAISWIVIVWAIRRRNRARRAQAG